MDKDNIKSAFGEYLIPLNTDILLKQVATLKLDRYVKKLDTEKTCKLFIYAQLMQLKSLEDISLHLQNKKALQHTVQLESISSSQLSRKLRDLDPLIFDEVFRNLIGQITSQIGVSSALQHLGRIHLIDSSTISMAIHHYRWAEFRKTKAGVKLHLRLVYVGDEVYPDEAILTPAKPADKKQLDRLIVTDPDALNVFDRGYVDYRIYDQYSGNSIRFVTRLKSNADLEIIEEKLVTSDSGIRREVIVRLGNPATYQMQHKLRLIETVDTEENPVVILTNDFKISTEELGTVYRKRWQIELFFKWMKQNLKLKTCYGHSRNAVYCQIRIALLVFCLLLLMKLKAMHRGRLLKVLKLLRLHGDSEYSSFIRALHRAPTRTSRGRQTWDSERIFRETLQQYIDGETAHLNDLTYDPV